jgi:DNA-directed RNA polymerase subunit RPC12/RpoP
MKMKQQLLSVNTSDFDAYYHKRPQKHIRERLTFDNRQDAFDYLDAHKNLYHGGVPFDKDGNSYLSREIWLEPTWENKATLRLEYARDNNVYTVCACCGAELHEHQKHTHMKTKYGIIGPECSKKLLMAGII